MDIKKVVAAWVDQENVASGASRWRKVALLLGLGWIALALYLDALWPLVLSVVVVTAWKVLAPKSWHISDLMVDRSREIVPDSLLARLADDQNIPPWAKAEIGARLARDGFVDFETLFETDARIERQAEKAELVEGQGYKKLTSYAIDSDRNAEVRTSEN